MVTKKVIQNEKLRPPLPVLPPGILWKDFVFVLSMGGLDKERKPVGKDIRPQAARSLERIAEVLQAENLSFQNVVKGRIALVNTADFEVVSQTYREISGEDFPACTFIQVHRCPIPGEDIKIQLIAHKHEKKQVQTDQAPALISGCPQAVAAEDLFFVQGMNGFDVKTGRLVAEDAVAQTEKALENIVEVLKAGNLNLGNIVKATIFTTNLNEADKVLEVYRKHVNFLAPCFLEVPRISTKDEKIMIDVVASPKMTTKLMTAKAPVSATGMAQGISAGDFVFVQGMGGVDAISGKLASKDISRQTAKALDNIEEVLKESGMTLDNAVDASLYVTDMEQYDMINEVYGRYMGEQPPARTCVEIPRMPDGCDIMIEVTAAR